MPFATRVPNKPCANCGVIIEVGEFIHYDKPKGLVSHEACGIPRAQRGGTPPKGKALDAWDRTVQHGRADVPLCDNCGQTITKDRPAIHLSCDNPDVPF